MYNLPKPKQEYKCSAAYPCSVYFSGPLGGGGGGGEFPGLPTVHAVSLMVCEIAIKNCTVRELSNLAYLLLRWSNRDEFWEWGGGGGASLQLVIIEG